MKEKLTDELITALLEVMNIPKSGYIEASLREKLAPINPKHYTEIVTNLMDNQDRFAKPIEKISTAIQKVIDKYGNQNDNTDIMAYLKRSYKGKVISDHIDGIFKKGTKIALSHDGDCLVNLYSGTTLSDGETIEVLEWLSSNMDKIGIINGYEYDHTKVIPMIKDQEIYTTDQNINTTALLAGINKA